MSNKIAAIQAPVCRENPAIPAPIPPAGFVPSTDQESSSSETKLVFLAQAQAITLPSDATEIEATYVGAGGSGAGGLVSGGAGGAAGGGCAVSNLKIPVAPGATVQANIGLGPLGAAIGTDGQDGGDTTISGGLITPPVAFGGRAGRIGTATNGGNGGGSGTSGAFAAAGSTGGAAAGAAGTNPAGAGSFVSGAGGGAGAGTGAGGGGFGRQFQGATPTIPGGTGIGGGAGGGSLYGVGGQGGNAGTAGSAATGNGAGGGGGGQNGAGARGTDGFALIRVPKSTVIPSEVAPAPPAMGTFSTLPQANFTFPGDATGQTWYPYRATAAAAYAIQRSTTNVFRFEIRQGDTTPEDIASGNGNTERCEINQNGNLDKSKVILWSFLQMIETGNPIGSNFCIVGQMHAVPDAGDVSAGPTPYQNLITGDILEFNSITDNTNPMLVVPAKVTRAKIRVQRNVWYRYDYRFKWNSDPAGDGFLEVSRNGLPIVKRVGPLGYNDVKGPSPQIGIYRGLNTEKLIVNFADIQLRYE